MLLASFFWLVARFAVLVVASRFVFWTALLIFCIPAGAEVPAGTPIEISLLTPLSSYHSRAPMRVTACVFAPVRSGGRVLIPSGSTIHGTLIESHRVGLGLWRERAKMVLRFETLVLPGGEAVPLRARLVGVDNAREAVDRNGAIRGIRATDVYSHRVGFRFARLAMGHPIALGPAALIQNLIFRFPDPEISYGTGTEMRIEILDGLPLERDYSGVEPDRQLDPDRIEAANRLVGRMPYWSYSVRQGMPVDITTLAFVGSREELKRAFSAARWTGSRRLSAHAGFKAVRAILENRPYPDAPMRTLLVEDSPPDLELQKSLNTFAKRHHLRIWKRSEQWDGRPVWLSAATQDIGTTFSLRPFGFTHRVDGEVDNERGKVLNDLLQTGCLDSATLILRSPELRFAGGSDRKHLKTDGSIAFLVLNSCENPRVAADAAPPSERPRLVFRIARRVVLTARNYAIRDNWYWRAGEAGNYGVRAMVRWHRNRHAEAAAALRPAPAVSGAALAPASFSGGRGAN
jgi:hypothetical protein